MYDYEGSLNYHHPNNIMFPQFESLIKQGNPFIYEDSLNSNGELLFH